MSEIDVLSLGAGVQSSTMLLMACHGELKKPDFVIFSDTGWEPKLVYRWLEWLKQEVAKFGVEIIMTDNGNIREDILKAVSGERFASLPFYTKGVYPVYDYEEPEDVDPNQLTLIDIEPELERKIVGYAERKGIVRRQCTNEYKIMPVRKKVRELLGYKPRERVKEKVIMWKGISTDEIERAGTSLDSWIQFYYPLIDKGMNRLDCLMWMERKGYPQPPKSSCIGCPFHNDRMWLDMKRNDPESWRDAIEIDKAIKKLPRFSGVAYLHSSCKPLEEVNLNEDQLELDFDGFGNECSGHCGV